MGSLLTVTLFFLFFFFFLAPSLPLKTLSFLLLNLESSFLLLNGMLLDA